MITLDHPVQFTKEALNLQPIETDTISPDKSSVRKPVPISWYRTHLDPKELKKVHERSDAKAWFQTLGYLGIIAFTGSVALYAAGHLPIGVVLLLIFVHGTAYSFMINAVHELGHGTVFRTKVLNSLFVRIFAFLGWINFEKFNASHALHHRYTLHPPDDLEVELPMRLAIKHFFLRGFVNIFKAKDFMMEAVRIACGKTKGEWETQILSESDVVKTRVVNWARVTLVGHGLILALSIYFKLWIIPVLVTLAPFYGGWLHFLCNNTQHIGLQDNVPDFRLCSRTFTLNPLVRFLYWHMNYHIEHHMYAAVPCYNLDKLHKLIKHDLPPCNHGIIATWKEIAAIQKLQDADPSYQHAVKLPSHG